MKRSYTYSMSWRLLAAVLAGTALAAGAPALFGQPGLAAVGTQNAVLTVFVSGPQGDRFTLVRSADEGWQLQAGWNAKGIGWTEAALASVEPPPFAAQQTLERPLSVFVDGPTGFTFIYAPDDGWKFVGSVVDRAP